MKKDRDYRLARVMARDKSCDGQFITGVLTTGIYCLPSCPARNPKAENIRFFQSEEKAVAAGLRPCLRCRPDQFYRSFDPDLDLVKALAEKVRSNPDQIEDAAQLVRMAGVSATKLIALFRRHFHVTPSLFLQRARLTAACRMLATPGADILDTASAAGYRNLSVFHEHFRRGTGLAPGGYKRLGETLSFQLSLPLNFRLAETLAYLGRDPSSPIERIAGSRLERTAWLSGRPVLLTLDFQGRAVRVAVAVKADPDPDRQTAQGLCRQAHRLVVRWLGLELEPRPFENGLRRHPRRLALIQGREGLRIPQTSDMFEGLVWAILGQQVNLSFTYQLRRELVELCGKTFGNGLFLHPTAEAIAGLDYEDLTRRRFSRRKAEYLIDLARAITAGNLDLEACHLATAGEVEARLVALRGIGPWSARYLMLRGLGLVDSLPVGDAGLVNGLVRFFHLDHKPGREETEVLMKDFAPYRGLATYHLWHLQGVVA